MKRCAIVAILVMYGHGHAAAQAVETRQIGDFFFVTEVDPITDATIKLAFTRSEEGASLNWRCSDDGYSVFVATDKFLDLEGPLRTEWRFDKKPSHENSWPLSTDDAAVFLPKRWEMAFERSARRSERILLRIHASVGRQYLFNFSLAGADSAIALLGCLPSKP